MDCQRIFCQISWFQSPKTEKSEGNAVDKEVLFKVTYYIVFSLNLGPRRLANYILNVENGDAEEKRESHVIFLICSLKRLNSMIHEDDYKKKLK